MPQANAEDGNTAAEMPDNVIGDTRFQRGAGAGGDDDVGGGKLFNFFQSYSVIAKNGGLMPQFAKVLDEVISKRIVVIDKEYQEIISKIVIILMFLSWLLNISLCRDMRLPRLPDFIGDGSQ
jgi:hypothetical protein